MRVLRFLVILVGVVVGLPAGFLLLFTALQLNGVLQKTKPVPQEVTAAQLVEKGAPENLHVELTGFTFGTPVIEPGKEGWECVWLPILPEPKLKKPTKQAIFYRANVRDQAAVDDLLMQTKLTALVTTPLANDSRWRVGFGPALRKAYPKQETGQTLFLAEPRVTLYDHTIELADSRFYDVANQSIVVWGGAGLLAFGLFGIFLTVKSKGGAHPARDIPDAAELRAKLASESPVSFHRTKASYIFLSIFLYGLFAAIFVLVGWGCIGVAMQAQNRGEPLAAVLTVFVSLPFFIGAWLTLRGCRSKWRTPTDIEVCHTGMRWRQGRNQRALLWSDFAGIERDIKYVQRAGYPGGLVGAMAQMNNPQPPIKIDTLKLTLETGETYRLSPNSTTDYLNFASTVSELWSDDIKNTDFSGVTQAWQIARGLGKKPGGEKEKLDRAYY
jgi:hypothetical protein